MKDHWTETRIETWSAEDCPVTVEYPASLMQEIDAAVRVAYERLARGGLETGGVLFGTNQGGVVRLAAWRPIPCEHTLGPGFLLSGQDEAALREVLRAPLRDPELRGLRPVGWFHSHTRSELFLSAEDRAIHARHFPEPGQVALVLRPSRLEATMAGFFVRDGSGELSQRSPREFAVHTPPERQAGHPAGPKARRAAPVRQPEALTARFPSEASARSALRWTVMLALPLIVAAGAAGVSLAPALRPLLVSASPRAGLSLHVDDSGGQMEIEWDRESATVLNAAGGLLEVQDGSERADRPLGPETLKKGRFTYLRKTGDVKIRLVVNSAKKGVGPAEEWANFLGPAPQSRDSHLLDQLQSKRAELEAEVNSLRGELQRESLRARRAEDAVRILQQRLAQVERR